MDRKLRIIFFGMYPHALPHLRKLLDSSNVDLIAVVSDMPAFRPNMMWKIKCMLKKRKSFIDPVTKARLKIESLCRKNGIPLHRPQQPNAPEFCSILKSYEPDLFIIASCNKILKKKLINVPKFGVVNFHSSLLPNFKGAVAPFWAIRMGEKKSGITAHYVTEEIDAGSIIDQEAIPITNIMTGSELQNQIGKIGGNVLLPRVLNKFFRNGKKVKAPAASQDPKMGSYYPQIKFEHCKIEWSKDSMGIYNLVRACRENMYAWFKKNDSKYLVRQAEIIQKRVNKRPGEVIKILGNTITVATADYPLKLNYMKQDAPIYYSLIKFHQGIIKGDVLE